MDYYLITFSNTHSAIAAQKFLNGKLQFCVMPTLREISNSCGISLKIVNASLEEIKQQMQLFDTSPSMYAIYFIQSNGVIEKKLL
ncbi:MAG: DUF3343 domain-containing protein [Velocimicrobium sp.]